MTVPAHTAGRCYIIASQRVTKEQVEFGNDLGSFAEVNTMYLHQIYFDAYSNLLINGKFVERRRRKATGLRDASLTIAGLPEVRCGYFDLTVSPGQVIEATPYI
jgi:hypothetical protein